MGLLLDLLFAIVYGGANLINANRSRHLHLYLDLESAFPLIPAFIYPYFSLLLLFMLPPFALGPRGLRLLAQNLAFVILAAGIAFLLLPTTLGFRPVSVELPPLFALLHRLDLPYNLVPSLHVAFGTSTILALTAVSPVWAKVLLWLWLGIMCVSVVLVHQHHLLDVFSGIALAALASQWFRVDEAR